MMIDDQSREAAGQERAGATAHWRTLPSTIEYMPVGTISNEEASSIW